MKIIGLNSDHKGKQDFNSCLIVKLKRQITNLLFRTKALKIIKMSNLVVVKILLTNLK